MTIDKAYILGLLVGGGKISCNSFIINLPFKKWGLDPQNMNTIAVDILSTICSKFRNEFSINVRYEIGSYSWSIIPIESQSMNEIQNALRDLNLPANGVILNSADLTEVKNLISVPYDESFLSGIFDTRTSVALSHRRFSNDAPTVSIEIPGSIVNYKFVIDLCCWLTDKGSVTDQILFNHPCQHSPSDPDYSSWKKGFKIRFLANSFLAKYSFAIQSKSITLQELVELQKRSEQVPCFERLIKKPSPVSVHSDIDSDSLPEKVRNKLFFHYFHICSLYGCPYAPQAQIKPIISEYKDLIFLLPRMQKGNIEEINAKYIMFKKLHFPHIPSDRYKITVAQALGDEKFAIYYEFRQALAYLFSESLNGKRHIGPMAEIINRNKNRFFYYYGDLLTSTPLLLINESNERAALISAQSSVYNQNEIDRYISVSGLEVEYCAE
ncbi:MAG: hypothetical protein PQJ50_12760 [Spirochaetales bacterium]|nr:hypothetical protein [Spirochaetales bacterium]